jgi:hypothetical protein
LHFIYFVGGTLTVSTTPWNILDGHALVATVYKDGSIYKVGEERHSWSRSLTEHRLEHLTVGARYGSGYTGSFTDTTFSFAQGVVFDEDIDNDSGGAQTTCSHWYRNLAQTALRVTTGNTTVYPTVGGDIAIDLNGVLTALATGKYGNYYLYGTNDPDEPVYSLVGQTSHDTLGQAREEAFPTILLNPAEWKLLYRVTYRSNGGAGEYIEATDYRKVSTGPAQDASGAEHNSLLGREDANSHPATAISFEATATVLTAENVQAAIAEGLNKFGTLTASGDTISANSSAVTVDDDLAVTGEITFGSRVVLKNTGVGYGAVDGSDSTSGWLFRDSSSTILGLVYATDAYLSTNNAVVFADSALSNMLVLDSTAGVATFGLDLRLPVGGAINVDTISANGTEITSSDDIDFAADKGVSFNGGDVLDAYASPDNTWTPTSSTLTFSGAEGRYSQLGADFAWVSFYVIWGTTADTTNAAEVLLPFTPRDQAYNRAGVQIAPGTDVPLKNADLSGTVIYMSGWYIKA